MVHLDLNEQELEYLQDALEAKSDIDAKPWPDGLMDKLDKLWLQLREMK